MHAIMLGNMRLPQLEGWMKQHVPRQPFGISIGFPRKAHSQACLERSRQRVAERLSSLRSRPGGFGQQLRRPLTRQAAAPHSTTGSSAESGAAAAPHFDLAQAVALAGAAFEAYLQPSGAEGFQERTGSGAEITYTDREFLAEIYHGVLYVELLGATGLKAADITGASDPYAVVAVGSSTYTSNVAYQTLNPNWNEKFFLYVKDASTDVLKLRVFDKDIIKSDDDLGVAVASLKGVENGQPQTLEMNLTGSGTGSVRLRCTLLKFSEFAEGLLDQMAADKAVVPELKVGMDLGRAQAKANEMLAEVAAASQRAAKKDAPKQEGLSLDYLKDEVFKRLSEITARKPEPADPKAPELSNKVGPSESAGVPNPWKVLAKAAGWKTGIDCWTPVAFVENHDTDTQAWVYRNQANREAVIAFRGTEQIKWKDFLTDLNLIPASLDPERVGDDDHLPLPLRLLKAAAEVPCQQIQVHSGFLQAYDSVKRPVLKILDAITGQGEKGHWRVLVTGHSLGGAIATLCAYELAVRRSPSHKYQSITMYNYGAPRAGNKPFAEAYNQLVRDSWRITNNNDIIPSVPRLLGYAHVKHSVRLTSDGQLLVQADDVRDVFGEGRGGVDVIQEIAARVAEQEQRWEDVYEEIKEAEMLIFNSLLDGSALEQHMETYYLKALKEVVLCSRDPAMRIAAAAALEDAVEKFEPDRKA